MLTRLRRGGYRLVPGKINLIDRAFTTLGVESFADLGGVWGVEGAYTFHARDKHQVKEAVLIDLNGVQAGGQEGIRGLPLVTQR
jgi:hypothetical protein